MAAAPGKDSNVAPQKCINFGYKNLEEVVAQR